MPGLWLGHADEPGVGPDGTVRPYCPESQRLNSALRSLLTTASSS